MTQKPLPASKFNLLHRKLPVDISMTSNEQNQIPPRINFHGQALDGRCLHRFAIATLFGSSVIVSGCQQLGLRARDEELTQITEEQDDWELSQSPQSRVPRPSLTEFKTQIRREKLNNSVAENRPSIGDRSSKPPQTAVVGYGQSGQGPEANDSSTILSSPNQDIDIEGALATVPAAYREILRKQLDAVQRKGDAIVAIGQSKGKTRGGETRSVSDTNYQTLDNTPQSDVHPSSRGADSLQIASNESQRGKVSVRMTDTKAEDRDVVATALAIQPKANEATVTSADAKASPATALLDASTSRVVQASAVSPIASSTALPLSPPPPLMPTPSSNAVLPSSPSTWGQSLSQAIEQLEKQVKETPASDDNLRISQEVTLRMLYVSQRRLEDAVRPIDILSENEQEFFRHQMHALYEASNPEAMPVRSRHWSIVMNSQREATNHLAAASNLEVKSVAFCTEVERYGVITKFPKYQFQPDQELLLYCEIENVAANKVKGQGYESQLQGSYEIIDSQGRKVADQLLPMEPEICQNHRRDYFIVYKIFMPQQIAAGNYQLRLTVEDMKAHKFGQSQLDFHVKK